MSHLALHQCVKDKTRGKNILDLVLVYDKNFMHEIKQLAPVGKSDHNTLVIKLNQMFMAQEKR